MLDSLIREIGALRQDTRRLDPLLLDERIVAADIDRHIADAAQAVDAAIAVPEDEDVLVGAL